MASNPLISPENSSLAARVRQHWARTRAGSASTAFQHASLGSRRRNLALDAAVDHFDDPIATARRIEVMGNQQEAGAAVARMSAKAREIVAAPADIPAFSFVV